MVTNVEIVVQNSYKLVSYLNKNGCQLYHDSLGIFVERVKMLTTTQ